MNTIELDKKDRDILFELSLDARKPVSEIAKKVRLSKQVVSYRIKKLEENKVIEGYYAILNSFKLGMLLYRIDFKYGGMPREKEQEILEFIKNHGKIGWIAQFDGDIDLGCTVFVRNGLEFEEVYNEIVDKFNAYFSKTFATFVTRIYHFKYKFLKEEKSDTQIILEGSIAQPQLDKTDYGIISLLARNGRASLSEIAAGIKVHPKVINYRIKNMVKKGIILGFDFKLNHKIIGYTHRKIYLSLKTASVKSLNRLISYIRQHKNTIYITKAIGRDDLEFELMTKSNEEFHEIMTELRYNFADLMKEYSSVIFYYEPKIRYAPEIIRTEQ